MIELFRNTKVVYASSLKNVVESKDTHSLRLGVIEIGDKTLNLYAKFE